jgi:hypothetical protein
MGSVRMSVPADLAADLARRGGIRIAIETGTWRGEGARLLSGIFDQVYSVELDPKVHAAARERHADLANVTFLQGNSPAVLRDLQRGIDEPVLFWLDAHGGWNYTPNVRKRLNPAQPPTPAGADSQCPLLDELQAVDSYAAAARSVILIDDARSFLGPQLHHRTEDWPGIAEVFDALRRINRRYVTVLDDVVIAVPEPLMPAVHDWWRGQLLKRRGTRTVPGWRGLAARAAAKVRTRTLFR